MACDETFKSCVISLAPMARELWSTLYKFPEERVRGTEPGQTQRPFMSKPWADMSLRAYECASSSPEDRMNSTVFLRPG